jgi:hypothetical protein
MMKRNHEGLLLQVFAIEMFLLVKHGYWDSQNDILGGNSSGVMPLNYVILRRGAPKNPYDVAKS